MIKSDLISRISELSPQLSRRDVERIVATVFDGIGSALASGNRVELRKFGTFFVKRRSARTGRNPRTGVVVDVPRKIIPFFRASRRFQARLKEAGEVTAAAIDPVAIPPVPIP
jgi:integration host factor subunit beta